MDTRKGLKKGSMLELPAMTITIGKEIGRGSNALVYEGSYPDMQGGGVHRVLIKELFPFDPDGRIYRDEDGTIVSERKSAELFSLHKKSFEYGNGVHLSLLYHYPDDVGGNINTFEKNGTLYTVLGYNGCKSLASALNETVSLSHTVKRMQELLWVLENFHRSGLLHLDIAPDNILLVGEGERERVMLIDYNSVLLLDDLGKRRDLCVSVKAGYSAPELRGRALEEVCSATDLYSVTAVLFRCVCGRELTPIEMTMRRAPDISKSDMVALCPATVQSKLSQILYKGLQLRKERRYGSTQEMMEELRELADRIEGVGVTHSSIWEAGKRTISTLLKSNAALDYLKDPDALFPAYVTDGDGEQTPVADRVSMQSLGGKNIFLTAAGGMGKTTAMLSALRSMSEKYSPMRPAAVYIPLNGRREGQNDYICDKILENLRFNSEIKGYDEARHALRGLLSKPIKTPQGDRPCVIIFLDGLNEVIGDASPILNEIKSLSVLEGVRIFITSRSEEEIEGFEYLKLMPLKDREVEEILLRHGLLVPKSHSVRELLKTPIMLSMFLRSAENSEKQPDAESEDELFESYISTLVEKRMESFATDSEERVKYEVAVRYILPALCAEMIRMGRPLSDAEQLRVVEKCYKVIASRLMIKAFPNWIGQRKAILSGVRSEEWYGVIVHEILWHALGLLIRTEQNEYIYVHSSVGEYLAKKYLVIRKRISRYKSLKAAFFGAIGSLAAVLLILLAMNIRYPADEPPVPFDEGQAQIVLINGMEQYKRVGRQYEYLRELIDIAETTPENYELSLLMYNSSVAFLDKSTNDVIVTPMLEELAKTGEVMPWTGERFYSERYISLFELYSSRNDEYAELVAVLSTVMADRAAYERYGEEYISLFSRLTEIDADITGVIYALSCRDHVEKMIAEQLTSEDELVRATAEMMDDSIEEVAKQNAHLPKDRDSQALMDRLRTLEGDRKDLMDEIYLTGAYGLYNINKEN